MKKNETLTLWLSVGAAIFAVILLYSYTQEKSAEISKAFGVQTTVVVAKKDIKEMETVQEDMVDLQQVPENFVQPGHVRQLEEIVGLVALAPISKSEQILKNKVIKPGVETGLSLQVAPGKRAITIPVDEVRGVAKLLNPGDRVDLVVALDVSESSSQKRHIKTLLQDTVILATGQKIVNELPRIHEVRGEESFIKNLRVENNFSNITLEVTPQEAQKIIYILSTNPSSLFFTLRHPSDDRPMRLRQTTLADVLSLPRVSKDRRAPASLAR